MIVKINYEIDGVPYHYFIDGEDIDEVIEKNNIEVCKRNLEQNNNLWSEVVEE